MIIPDLDKSIFMQKKKMQRSSKVDLLAISTSLDESVTELVPVACDNLLAQILRSDKHFMAVESFNLKGLVGAGVFFEVSSSFVSLYVHESHVPNMYHVENFSLKRNYFVSDPNLADRNFPETLGTSQAKQKDHEDRWSDIMEREETESPFTYSLGSSSDFRRDPDSNPQRGMEDLTLSYNQLMLGRVSESDGMRKQQSGMSEPKFLEDGFLRSLPRLERRWQPFNDFIAGNPRFIARRFYLFDYVAMFLDCTDVVEPSSGFNISWLEARFKLLNSLSGTRMENMPLQDVQVHEGWTKKVLFLCTALNGQDQICFLKLAILFLVRSLDSGDKLPRMKINDAVRSFLNGDKSFRDAATRTIMINKVAFENNLKVTIDCNYVLRHMSDVGLG